MGNTHKKTTTPLLEQYKIPTKFYNILIVDNDSYTLSVVDNIAIQKPFVRVYPASNLSEARDVYEKHNFDVVIINFTEVNGNTFDFISSLKDDKIMLPVIVLTECTGCVDPEDRLRFLQAGATFFLEKPFTLLELMTIIENLLSLNEAYNNLEHADNIMRALNRAIEARDPYTKGHAERTADIAVRIFDRVGLAGEQREDLYSGCILHDIGKIALPDSILKSAEKLTKEQYELVKKHPTNGKLICLGLHKLKEAIPVIEQHHERLDGTGYPKGRTANDIHILAQIAAVADIYESLTSNRSYRKAMTRTEALEIIDKEKEEGKLNAHFVSVLHAVVQDMEQEGEGIEESQEQGI